MPPVPPVPAAAWESPAAEGLVPQSVGGSRLRASAAAIASVLAAAPAVLLCRRSRRAGCGWSPGSAADAQLRSRRAPRGRFGMALRAALAPASDAPVAHGGRPEEPARPSEAAASTGGGRAQRLKDIVYVKELRAAITSGEFALRLRGKGLPTLVDYQGLCNRLYTFANKLRRWPLDPEVLSEAKAQSVLNDLVSMRTRLEDRLMEMSDGDLESRQMSSTGPPNTADPAAPAMSEVASAVVDLPDPRRLLLYMREDKTVDFHWDEALNEANKAARFSRDLWERLNGRPSHGAQGASEQPSQGQERETPRVAAHRGHLAEAERFLEESLRAQSECWASASSLVAGPGGRQSRFEETRMKLLECDQKLREWQSRVRLARIEWLLERAAAALEADLDRASVAEWDVSGRQLKLLVHEFSVLDRQAAVYRQFMPEDSSMRAGVDFASTLEPEELYVLDGDVTEFVTRLGLQVDSQKKNGFSATFQTLLVQGTRTLEKMKVGFSFYVTGVKILWQDLQYATGLFSKAAFSGYTLQPREVRTIQRTAKDIATFIPFMIILIIPLTPVGHVLIFSFIQKFFPDFFPSTFTERRQNVIKVYRDIVPDTSGLGTW